MEGLKDGGVCDSTAQGTEKRIQQITEAAVREHRGRLVAELQVAQLESVLNELKGGCDDWVLYDVICMLYVQYDVVQGRAARSSS